MFSISDVDDYTSYVVDFVTHAPQTLSAFVIFSSSLIEYIFPPFPGDVITVAGGFFAARGALPLWLAFVSLVLGSWAGASLSWLMGTWAVHHPSLKSYITKFVPAKRMDSLHTYFDKYGTLILASNRFFPVIRGFIFFAAGLAGVSYKRVAIWSLFSGTLWNATLIGLGYFLSIRFEDLLTIVERYTQIIVLGMILAAFIYLLSRVIKKNWFI